MGKELGLNTAPPEAQTQQAAENTNTEQTAQTTESMQVSAQETAQTEAQQTVETTQVPAFFEGFNKNFGTTYKSDDELRGLLDTPKKVADYEARLSDYEAIKRSAEERQKKIEELEGLTDPLKYFSSPDAYIAEQLRIKNPDKDPVLLHKIATTDLSQANDFDLLIEAEKLFNKNLPEGGRYVKDVLYKRYGIDAESNPAEWDGALKTQIAMDANTVRNRLTELKKGIEMPKIVSKEERERLATETLAQRQQKLAPVKEQFTKFEKFSYEGLDYDVPAEYKEKSSEFFDGYFLDAGQEMNEENLKTALQLRDANFLYENFGKIKEVIIKEAQTALRKQIDDESHNTTLPNTATATDQNEVQQLQGIGKLVSDLKSR